MNEVSKLSRFMIVEGFVGALSLMWTGVGIKMSLSNQNFIKSQSLSILGTMNQLGSCHASMVIHKHT